MNLRMPILITSVLLSVLSLPAARARAGGEEGEAAMLKAFPAAKHSLLDGIRQAAKAPGVVLSAKFEDEGKGLSLSVYVAGRGLTTQAEENVLQELAGSPNEAEWTPGTETFEDVTHVARSAEQLTLMRLTSLALADVVAKVEKSQKGKVFSVKPEVRGRKAVFRVRVALDGKASDILLDLMTGDPIVEANK